MSGKRYALDPNALGWRSVTLAFAGGGTASVSVEFADRVETRPVGLNGVPSLSPRGRFGLPVAVHGRWNTPTAFTLDYDEVGNVNAFICEFAFEDDDTVSIGLKERSGELDVKIGGRHMKSPVPGP